jgi:hypothetical protein
MSYRVEREAAHKVATPAEQKVLELVGTMVRSAVDSPLVPEVHRARIEALRDLAEAAILDRSVREANERDAWRAAHSALLDQVRAHLRPSETVAEASNDTLFRLQLTEKRAVAAEQRAEAAEKKLATLTENMREAHKTIAELQAANNAERQELCAKPADALRDAAAYKDAALRRQLSAECAMRHAEAEAAALTAAAWAGVEANLRWMVEAKR